MGHNVSQIFPTELFWESLPWGHQRNKARRFERWEFPAFWRDAGVPRGAFFLIPGLILKIHQLRHWKYPPVLSLCAVTWGLPECHPNLCSCSWVTCAEGLQCSWCPGNDCSFTCLLHSLQDCFIWFQLFQLCKFPPIMFLFLLAVDGWAALFPWHCWQVTELTKCCSQQLLAPAETSSAPHWAAPPQSSSNTREIRILRLDVSPSSLNNNPAWAQMSCQAGWWCCLKFTIIYFSNLISKMEMRISAHDFQVISYFLSAFQCCWNALCYRQNTLIMMGLFFQQLPLSNVTHRENGKLPLPSCVKHLKRREEKELLAKHRW